MLQKDHEPIIFFHLICILLIIHSSPSLKLLPQSRLSLFVRPSQTNEKYPEPDDQELFDMHLYYY